MVRVESLLEHEAVIEEVARRLLLEFKNWGKLFNPIIVDQHHIVLDGNHRTHVFKKMNFSCIPACRIDYFSEKVCLRFWYRLYGGVTDLNELLRFIEAEGGSVAALSDQETLIKTLEANVSCMGIRHGDYLAAVRFRDRGPCDPVGISLMIEKIQQKLMQMGKKPEYIPCRSVLERNFCSTLDAGDLVIYTPRITKEMVVEAAKKKTVFAPKTTRHLVAARPLNINVPITWFREETSLEEMDARFGSLLKKKKVRRFGPGQVVDGRYYEEELFVFYDG